MKLSDLMLMMLCCLAWAGNFVVSAWAVGNNPVPPFMLAATRAVIVIILMARVLYGPLPKNFGRLLIVCVCVGPLHLGCLYTGLQTASASGSSIVSQMLIPFATILSVIFLGEKVGWRRSLAIIGAIFGVVVMVYEPGAIGFDLGLILIILAYLALAIGSVVMKTVGDVDWKHYVTWMAVVVLLIMAPASFLFESGQGQVWAASKKPLLIAASYAAVCVTIFAHGQYFNLVRRYDISVVVPLTLMVTVFACALGVIFLKETLYPRYIIGALLILPCVWYIARRQGVKEAGLRLAEDEYVAE